MPLLAPAAPPHDGCIRLHWPLFDLVTHCPKAFLVADPKQASDVYLRDVLARPDLANKEQCKWAKAQDYLNAANDEATWTDTVTDTKN